jgi:PAN domain
MFLVFVLVSIVLMKTTSTLAPSPPAPSPVDPSSRISQPMYDANGNYQDVDIITTGGNNGFKNNITLDTGTPSWSEANINCWQQGASCFGIRHDFDTKQTWYLSKDPTGKTQTSVLSVLRPTVQYDGASYSLPLAIVALKSVANPLTPVNCVWTQTTPACSPAPCGTAGTPVQTSWAITTPAANGGTCAAAPASTSVSCPAGPQCPWLPFGSLNRPSPVGSPIASSPVSSPARSPIANPLDAYDYYNNNNSPGNDITAYNATPTACATYCSANSSCGMFVVSKDGSTDSNGNNCYLKTASGVSSMNQGRPAWGSYVKK